MNHATAGLERRLGTGAAVALVVGEIIGIGIFLTPAEMAKALGSPFWVLVVWLAVGATALCGALCYGELAARYPEAGGGYVYLREAWGPGLAFLYGWKSLLVMDPGLTAAFAAGIAQYVAYLTPLSPAGRMAVAMGVILAVAIVNALGVRAGARLLGLLTVLKLLLLSVIVVWGFAFGHGQWSHFAPFVTPRPGSAPLGAGLAGGIVAAFFSFGGFWDVAKVAGEIRDPGRSLPRALALGVSIVTVVYILTSAVLMYLVPLQSGSSGDAIAIQAGLACLLVALGTFGEIVAYFIFVTVAFVALTVTGLFRLPRPGAGVYRVPGYPATLFAFLALLMTLLGLLAAGSPKQAALGVAVVALGAPVYRFLMAPRRHALSLP